MVMQKKTNKKKLLNLIIFLAVIFIIFIYFLNASHNYNLEYNINDVKVNENYHKKEKYYSFIFTLDNKEYEVISFDKYTNKRKLVEDIKITKNDDNTCLSFKSKNINLYDVCSNEEEFFYPNNSNEFKKNDIYKNIQIVSLENHTFLLWNYHEFVYLSPKKNTTISLFNKDEYKLNLIYQTKDYLLVPDYNNDYQFSKINLIAFKNAKVSEIKLRYDLYFDSYFLGDYKNKVYLYDNKNELEYYIDLKKKDIYKTDYKINNDGKWESVTNQKLKNNKLSFTNTKYYNYTLKDNKLYGTFKKDYLVTNKDVSKIVKVDNLDIYYISKDTLYYFNPLYGEKPLLKYSEWEFNNTNMIFIY